MNYPIITIAREYGSGGRQIGQAVAQALNIPFYDKELIHLAAQESGLAEEFIRSVEQKPASSFLYSIFAGTQVLPAADQVFLAQARVIQDVADQGPCVIVGRCANYILRERKDCMNVFIHASLEERIRRSVEEYGDTDGDIKGFVTKKDKNRAAYFQTYTQNKWTDTHNYHLAVNSDIGISVTCSLLVEGAKSFLKGGSNE